MPLREEVLGQIDGGDGRVLAVLTRNGYGSVVLNAERVMFVDIDFPAAIGGGTSLFKGLFGRKQKSPEQEKEEHARQAVNNFIEDNPAWGMRLYRTFGGLRAIVMHDVMDPQSAAALDVLKLLGSDPLYIKLCKAQECFPRGLLPSLGAAVANRTPAAPNHRRKAADVVRPLERRLRRPASTLRHLPLSRLAGQSGRPLRCRADRGASRRHDSFQRKLAAGVAEKQHLAGIASY